MLKNLERIVGIVVLIVALSGILAGAKPVTITLTSWNASVTFKQIFDIFNASQEEVFIDFQPVTSGNYKDRVLAMFAAGQAPDILHMDPTSSSTDFINNGVIRPIDDYVAIDKIDLSDVLPGAWWYARLNGKLYGFPLLGSPLVTTGVLVNRDHYAEAGIKIPAENWTYDDFIRTGQKLTLDVNSDGVKERYGADGVTLCWHWDWIFSNGVDYVAADNKTCTLNLQPAYEGLQRMADISLVHGVSPIYGSPDSGAYTFAAQKTSMSFATPMANIRNVQAQYKFDWSILPVPALAAGSVGRGGSLTIGMSTQSRQTDAVWKFFKWLIKADTERLLVQAGTAILPVNRSVLLSPQFWKFDVPPYDLRGFLNRIPKAIPFIPQFWYINQELMKVLPIIMRGEKSANIAMQELAPTITSYILQNPK